ncbi:High-affinity nicotinic acid transporter, partial [Colletotrichum scovillei]
MAELAALGVAANIIQFLELGLKVSASIMSTYRSITDDGLLPRLVELKAMAEDLQRRCVQLQADATIKVDDGMKSLLQLCKKTSKELVNAASGLTTAIDCKYPRLTKAKLSVRAYFKENSIIDIQKRLREIKTAIFEGLQILLFQHRSEVSDHVRSLGDASAAWNRATNARLDQMSKDIGKLLESENEVSSTIELEAFSLMLSRFVEDAKHQGNILQILKSLRFAQIIERRTEIPKAHQNTFEWIFQESTNVNFSSWLQSPNGIFWITGKPGSGKSTLMKFVTGHEKTYQLGNIWAGPHQLVIASHFFWSIRNGLQSSQEGLLRALLFQITVKCPELIPDVFPERYASLTHTLEPWTIEELISAFERLRGASLSTKRILMFIDGLDEYKGDHKDLLKFLDNMAHTSGIKICCASRPWRIFEDAYGNSLTRIRMDQLTAQDMAIYVRDVLGQHDHYQSLLKTHQMEATNLIEIISQKSEGVFFWVALVVKSLARGLDNWDDLAILQRRVADFPSDLDEFFQRMLDSIEDVYKETAYRIFSALLIADMPIPVICFMIMDTYFEDMWNSKSTKQVSRSLNTTSISLTSNWDSIFNSSVEIQPDAEEALYRGDQNPINRGSSVPSKTSRELSTEKLLTHMWTHSDGPRKRDQILVRCCDLVQSWEVDACEPFNLRIGFLHRTVAEFLQRSNSYQSLVPLKHQRYWLARSFAESGPQLGKQHELDESNVDICMGFVNRSLHTIEQADIYDILASGPGLLNICGKMMDKLETSLDSPGALDSFRLACQIWARTTVAVEAALSTPTQRLPHRKHLFSAVRSVLKGSWHVEAGDPPEIFWTKLVDLSLLRYLLSRVELPDEQPELLAEFGMFLDGLKIDRGLGRPLNAFEACKLMIECGAVLSRRDLEHEAEADSYVSVPTSRETIEAIRGLEIFTEKGISDLSEAFPPEAIGMPTVVEGPR